MPALNFSYRWEDTIMNLDLDSAVATLKSLPRMLDSYISNIPEGLLDVRRAEGVWTIREHVYHLAEVQAMLGERIQTIGNRTGTRIVPYVPEETERENMQYRSVAEALVQYGHERDKQIKQISSLQKSSFEHTAHHPEYTIYNLPVLINHIVFHDYWHLYRIEEIWLLKDECFK